MENHFVLLVPQVKAVISLLQAVIAITTEFGIISKEQTQRTNSFSTNCIVHQLIRSCKVKTEEALKHCLEALHFELAERVK